MGKGCEGEHKAEEKSESSPRKGELQSMYSIIDEIIGRLQYPITLDLNYRLHHSKSRSPYIKTQAKYWCLMTDGEIDRPHWKAKQSAHVLRAPERLET